MNIRKIKKAPEGQHHNRKNNKYPTKARRAEIK
jgi:hypothetical protein